MTSVPRWEPDGTESPAERTDPLLPAITDDMLPPLDLPRLPALDDRTLARMLAELEGDDAGLVDGESSDPRVDRAAADPTAAPSAELTVDSAPPPSAPPPNAPRPNAPRPNAPTPNAPPPNAPTPLARNPTPPSSPGPAADLPGRPLRLVEHPAGPVGYRPARGPAGRPMAASKYVRRDVRPPEVPADALSLTGLTRRSGGRVGSILFKVAFVGIFVLILLQAIISLLTPGG